MRALPKTTPEQRAPFYADVEDLTTIGFLSHTIGFAGARLSFRSLCSGDLFMLRTHGDSHDWQTWMIASSVWMVNGYNLLGESNSTYYVYKKLCYAPQYILDILFSIVKGLFARQNKAIGAAEAYCYENASRFRWKASTGPFIGSMSGIPGADRFGLNSVMQMWRFFNEIEDRRNYDNVQWDGFKLAASASAPKGVQKIDKHDRNQREQEENRRQDVLDLFYYVQRGVILPDTKRTDIKSIALRAKSVEDLEAEMQRWVVGEDDSHDKAINQYKNAITDRYDHERDERAVRRDLLRRKHDEMESDTKPKPLVGYTLDQLEHVVKGRKPGVAQIYSDPQGLQEKMYQRHLQLAEKGLLDITDDGGLQAPKADPQLMDLISNRQVPYKVED